MVDNNYELYHHGVKGMKWGVRKTVYKSASEGFRAGSEAARTIARSTKKSKKTTKALSQMSDQELRAKINRLQMEQQYSELNPSKVSRGANYVGDILSVVGSIAAIGASVATIAVALKKN